INFSNGSNLVVGLSLFIAIILAGRVGGGHYNGSVTVAIYIIESKWKKNLPVMLFIILADILGAYVGILLAMALQQTDDPLILKPRDHEIPLWHVVLEGAMFPAILVGVIDHRKYPQTSPSKDCMLSALTIAIRL